MSFEGALAEKVEETSETKFLSDEEIVELVLDHRENGRKLARSLLRRWRARMNPEEVDSIVDLALCEAAKRFDPSNGASFMTFYFYHLRGCLVRSVSKAVHNNNVLLAFEQNAESDISDWAGVGEDDFQSHLPECAAFGLHEIEGPEKLLMKKEAIERCRVACKDLDELEREVIIRSFGHDETLVDIAESLGYSRCHISRVKKRALEQLAVLLGGERAAILGQQDNTPKPRTRSKKKRRVTRRRGRKRQTIRYLVADKQQTLKSA